LAVDHVKCFELPPNPVLIPDAQTLGREWAASRGWNIKVPESAAGEELQLLGMRRCLSMSGGTAHLMYRWHGQPLSVYVLNGQQVHLGDVPQIIERLGQEEIIWSKGGRTYVIVTRGRPSDLEHVTQYVRARAE
jgi:hypothetical protein